MRDGLSARRHAVSALLFTFLAFATGCTSMTTPSSPKHTGTFDLSGTTSSVQALLDRLRDRMPPAMQAQGFADAVFNADDGRQWATVSLRNPPWRWIISIQFVRTPGEDSPRANAWIRVFALETNPTISETELDKIVPKLRQALEAAAGA